MMIVVLSVIVRMGIKGGVLMSVVTMREMMSMMSVRVMIVNTKSIGIDVCRNGLSRSMMSAMS